MKNLLRLALPTLLLPVVLRAQNYPLVLEASENISTPKLTLRWKPVTGATGYTVSRKAKGAASWGTLSSLPASDTAYADLTIGLDTAFEYRVESAGGTTPATGYLYGGVRAPAIHHRGTLLMVLDSSLATACAAGLQQYAEDASGDGWRVARVTVPPTTAAPAVRAAVVSRYGLYPDLKSVVIFGHVAVPYSGNLAPDGHAPDHYGAWPTDTYYADMDSFWTDDYISTTAPDRTENDNIPGDGKWDQSYIPSALELQIGRVDLSNMPLFSTTHGERMASYLARAHAYKTDSADVPKRALVDDNLGAFSGEYFSANAFRGYPPVVGRDSVKTGDLLTTLGSQAYRWAYGCGWGWYTSSSGVGTTAAIASGAGLNTIFMPLFGSYFGDWDVENSFLRAPLCASTPALASWWAGRPNWWLHHMALGETIGHAAQLSMNNTGVYTPTNYGTSMVHMTLMGDPTLRAGYVKPSGDISATPTTGGTVLTWTASPDTGVDGYYIYRADSMLGAYARISGLLSAPNPFTDTATGLTGTKWYMVRAARLESTPSGSFYNLSLGRHKSVAFTGSPLLAQPEDETLLPVAPAPTGWSLFPNPGRGEAALQAVVEKEGTARIAVTDVIGRGVWMAEVPLAEGANIVSLPVAGWAPGAYAVRLESGGLVQGWMWVKE